MGIQSLLKIPVNGKTIKETFIRVTYKDLDGKTIGVDALALLFASLTSGPILKDTNGHVTLHISTIINKLIRMYMKQIWVFDNIKKVDFKSETIEKRMKSGYKTEIFKHISLSDAIKDLKKILDLANIPYIISPPEVEAETYLCEMKRYNLIDYILSKDTDILAYGFDLLVFDTPKTGFLLYRIKHIRKLLKVTEDQFRKLCVMLGTDFNGKTAGVGFGRMLANLDLPLTSEQYRTYVWFTYRVKLDYQNNIDMLKGLKDRPLPSIKKNQELIEYLLTHDFVKMVKRLS